MLKCQLTRQLFHLSHQSQGASTKNGELTVLVTVVQTDHRCTATLLFRPTFSWYAQSTSRKACRISQLVPSDATCYNEKAVVKASTTTTERESTTMKGTTFLIRRHSSDRPWIKLLELQDQSSIATRWPPKYVKTRNRPSPALGRRINYWIPTSLLAQRTHRSRTQARVSTILATSEEHHNSSTVLISYCSTCGELHRHVDDVFAEGASYQRPRRPQPPCTAVVAIEENQTQQRGEFQGALLRAGGDKSCRVYLGCLAPCAAFACSLTRAFRDSGNFCNASHLQMLVGLQ